MSLPTPRWTALIQIKFDLRPNAHFESEKEDGDAQHSVDEMKLFAHEMPSAGNKPRPVLTKCDKLGEVPQHALSRAGVTVRPREG